MNSLTTQYRLEQPPAERAILPPILSGLDEMQVVEHNASCYLHMLFSEMPYSFP